MLRIFFKSRTKLHLRQCKTAFLAEIALKSFLVLHFSQVFFLHPLVYSYLRTFTQLAVLACIKILFQTKKVVEEKNGKFNFVYFIFRYRHLVI